VGHPSRHFQSYLSPIQTRCWNQDKTDRHTFNPTLVQFKPGRADRTPCATCACFQSYLSPIQTVPAVAGYDVVYTFNPTLVQFKLCAPSSICTASSSFQSYLSPIQTCRSWRRCRRIVIFQSYLSPIQTPSLTCSSTSPRTFNPTLVQFKPGRDPGEGGREDLSILP